MKKKEIIKIGDKVRIKNDKIWGDSKGVNEGTVVDIWKKDPNFSVNLYNFVPYDYYVKTKRGIIGYLKEDVEKPLTHKKL